MLSHCIFVYASSSKQNHWNIYFFDVISKSQRYLFICKWIFLGYKIPQIENMGATLDQFDTIDFSDNDLRRLDGFPYLPRIKCLLLNNNRIVWVFIDDIAFFIFEKYIIQTINIRFQISRISDNLHEFLPNLESIILTGNNIQEFSDLDPLVPFTKLETLSLLTNPITTDPHYREFIAYKWVFFIFCDYMHGVYCMVYSQQISVFCYRFPKLRLLDFRKIRQKDRAAAIELFKSKKGKEILKEIAKKAKAAAANPAAAESNSSKGINKYLSLFYSFFFYFKMQIHCFSSNSVSRRYSTNPRCH